MSKQKKNHDQGVQEPSSPPIVLNRTKSTFICPVGVVRDGRGQPMSTYQIRIPPGLNPPEENWGHWREAMQNEAFRKHFEGPSPKLVPIQDLKVEIPVMLAQTVVDMCSDRDQIKFWRENDDRPEVQDILDGWVKTLDRRLKQRRARRETGT